MVRLMRKKSLVLFLFCFLLYLFVLYQPWNSGDQIKATMNILKAVESRDTSAVVLPFEQTQILQPQEKNCENDGQNIFAIFMVISAPANREQRDVIRSTLGTLLERESVMSESFVDNELRQGQFKLLFFMGRDLQNDAIVTNQIREEFDTYGDIVLDDFAESYLNLTVKTLRMLKWVLGNCRDANYVVKIDDDVHVNLGKYLEFLLKIDPEEAPSVIAGHLYNDIPIDRNPASKWFTPKKLFPFETFPNFTAGFFYTLGMEAAAKIYNASLSQPVFHLEDVFLTGIIGTQMLKIKILAIPDIHPYWIPLKDLWTSTCSIYQYVAIHRVSPDTLRCWNSFNLPKFRCGNLPAYLYCMSYSDI